MFYPINNYNDQPNFYAKGRVIYRTQWFYSA